MDKTMNNLFSQQMTRREFLLKIGLLLITLTGINALIKSLSQPAKSKEQSGFGSGSYGR